MLALSLLLAAIFADPTTANMIPVAHTPQLQDYGLADTYAAGNFFKDFEVYSGPDPKKGFVQYVDNGAALEQKLIGTIPTGNNSIYIGVDHHNKAPKGRASIRVTSKKAYDHGLFIADIQHMPGGICGVWPAFWLLGPDWPAAGEIDIIEGVDEMTANRMSMHTKGKCSLFKSPLYSGSLYAKECGRATPNVDPNIGCTIQAPTGFSSFGTAFNKAGGGAFVTEWDANTVSVWYFPRDQIPDNLLLNANITAKGPAHEWGLPMAHFAPNCATKERFSNMKLVFDTTFCGAWAGGRWQDDCKAKAPTCEAFVRDNPAAFKEAYWLINHVSVFKKKKGSL